MNSRRSKFLFVSLLVVAGILTYFLVVLFLPAEYNVPAQKVRASTKYWNLSTGSRIAYIFLEGSGNQFPYPIIYLHGGPGAGITDREIYAYQKVALQGFDVYLYDQVGCGGSARLANISDYTAQRHIRDLEAVRATIGAEKVILAGQSWGSILALSYLAKYPAAVEKLIITAPAPIQPANRSLAEIPPPDSLKLLPPTYSNKRTLKTGSLRERATYYLARKYGIKLMSDEEADKYATWTANELNKLMVCEPVKGVSAEGTEGLYCSYLTSKSIASIPDQRKILGSLQTPTLVLRGQCDNQPWGYTTEYLSLMRNSRFHYIPGGGHNIFIEQPGKYADAIVSFLKN